MLIWMQAKLSFLDVQNNALCYVDLDACQMEFLGRLLVWTVKITIVLEINWTNIYLKERTNMSKLFIISFLSQLMFLKTSII